ncbi:MAG: cyclic pyranopterin monophosphate synthase MoaC [Candidatus Zipacnadales bacterium]
MRPPDTDDSNRRIVSASLTHADERGAVMVDVTPKPKTQRHAVASGCVRMKPETLALIRDQRVAKGSVMEVARIAGIMAAKRTSELIPLCHPLTLTDIAVDLVLDDKLPGIRVKASTTCIGRTGVEMEALAAVAIACLTVYDMCKAVDREMIIEDIKLIEKSGGMSGDFRREEYSP